MSARDSLLSLLRQGTSWQSKDRRDNGLTVHVEKVEDGWVTYKRFNRRRIRVEGFLKLYRPFATDSCTEAEWNRAYDDAMAWRDWGTCGELLKERELQSWWRQASAA